MSGKPRTKHARVLAVLMRVDLDWYGPAPVSELLDRYGYGPTAWPDLARWQRAAARMAVRDLLAAGDVRLDVHDRLYIAPRQRLGATP